jgi:hypothetical protein
MPATTLQLTVATSELAARMREHLRGPGANPPPKVIWQARGQRVLLHLDSLELRAHDGWLLAGLDLQADQTGRQTLQLVFHLGKPGEGDGLTAAVTINTTTVGAAQLAASWGDDLQRLLWDGLLDLLEAALRRAGREHPGEELALQGYGCADEQIVIEVVTGVR